MRFHAPRSEATSCQEGSTIEVNHCLLNINRPDCTHFSPEGRDCVHHDELSDEPVMTVQLDSFRSSGVVLMRQLYKSFKNFLLLSNASSCCLYTT